MIAQLTNYYWLIFLLPIILVIGIILDKKLYYGIYAGAFLLPLEDLTQIFSNFTLIKFVVTITFLIWLLQAAIRKRNPRLSKLVLWLVVLDVLSMSSYFWITNVSSYLSSLLTFTQLILWLIITSDLLDTEEKVKTAAKLFILGSIIVSVMALILMGSGNLNTNRAIAFQGQNPNGFSRTIGIAFLMLIYSISSEYFNRNSIINYIGAIITGLSVILAVSRGTYLALVISLLLLFMGGKQKHKFRTIFFFILLLGVFVLLFQGFFKESILPRLIGYQDLGGRNTIWFVATQMIKENFWLGVGFGNFPDVYGSYSIVLRGWYANSGSHNVYIRIISELGVFGLLFFVSFQLSILKEILRLFKNSSVKYFLLSLFVYLLVGGMSTDLLLDKAYWFSFGLIIAFISVRKRYLQKSNPADRKAETIAT